MIWFPCQMRTTSEGAFVFSNRRISPGTKAGPGTVYIKTGAATPPEGSGPTENGRGMGPGAPGGNQVPKPFSLRTMIVGCAIADVSAPSIRPKVNIDFVRFFTM